MERAVVVTDSSAGFVPADAPRPGIRVLPITIHVPSGDVLPDGPEAAGPVYEALRNGEPVKSSAPSVLEYLAAMEQPSADSVVVVTPATEFTTMYRNARLAAELAKPRVAVVDSRTAAAAQHLVVRAGADAAVAGAAFEEVVRIAEDAARRAELVAALDDLDPIRRSGRVPPVTLGLARHLGVRPVFRLHGGAVERLGVPRQPQRALDRIRREANIRGFDRARQRVAFHAESPDRLRKLVDLAGGVDEIVPFTPAMGIHTGPGVVGLAWLRPPELAA